MKRGTPISGTSKMGSFDGFWCIYQWTGWRIDHLTGKNPIFHGKIILRFPVVRFSVTHQSIESTAMLNLHNLRTLVSQQKRRGVSDCPTPSCCLKTMLIQIPVLVQPPFGFPWCMSSALVFSTQSQCRASNGQLWPTVEVSITNSGAQ